MKYFKSQEAAQAACHAKRSGVSYAAYVKVAGEGWLVKLYGKFGQFAGFASVGEAA